MFCGIGIAEGEPFERVRFGGSFTDYASLAAPASDLGCWGCQQSRKTETGMLQLAAKAVYTAEGVFKSHSRAEQAYHLYNPPVGSFLWVNALAKAEHVVWRTPVALNSDRFPFRVGPHLLVVERARVFEVLDRWKRALTAVQAADKKYAKTVQLCQSLDPDLMDAGSVRFKRWVLELNLPEVSALRNGLSTMSVGDTWAISVLVLYHNRFGWDARPEKPNKLFS